MNFIKAITLIILSPLLLIYIWVGLFGIVVFGGICLMKWALGVKQEETDHDCLKDALSLITLLQYKPTYSYQKKYANRPTNRTSN